MVILSRDVKFYEFSMMKKDHFLITKMDEFQRDLHYEIFLRLDHDQIIDVMRKTWTNSIMSSIFQKIYRDQNFWYQKLSSQFKTFEGPGVDWLRAYKFLEDGLSEEKLIVAAEKGLLPELEILILNGVNPAASNNRAIIVATQRGHVAIVDRLLKDKRVIPINYLIRLASRNGHIATLNRLLEDVRLDPSYKREWIFSDRQSSFRR